MTTVQKEKESNINIGRLVWGIIALAAGIFLGVLTFVLPEDEMMFMIGDNNMPIVPAFVLAAIGLFLLLTLRQNKEDEIVLLDQTDQPDVDPVKVKEKQAMNKRLESIGWGLFLIMLGGFSLVPHEVVPKGMWSIGVGVIMLGLNATRYYYGIKMSGFTTFLGILSLLGGIAQLLGWYSLEGALLFFILGAYLILKPWFEKNRVFGKVEEG